MLHFTPIICMWAEGNNPAVFITLELLKNWVMYNVINDFKDIQGRKHGHQAYESVDYHSHDC